MDLRAVCIDRVSLQKQFRRPKRLSLRSGTRTAAPQVRPLNRGARAWESDAESVWLQCRHPEVPGVVTRSNVHAVTDDTSAFYVKIVCKALDAIVAGIRDGRWPPPTGIFDLDGILRAIVHLQLKVTIWLGGIPLSRDEFYNKVLALTQKQIKPKCCHA